MSNLVFRIFGEDVNASASLRKVGAEAGHTQGALSKMGSFATLALVGAGVAAVKMAGDYQASLTSLVTGAGESQANLKQVGDGMLHMAGKVGISAQDLSKGMYLIESSGKHGAQGLLVLKAAAEGARVGAADMATVADGLTTALNDYKIPASQAAVVTSQLVATVAAGKTHMGDLAGALATVLPAASAAHVGLSQVLGAMATMTAAGTPAADAATYLKQTIAQLSNPTAKAALEMKNLGLSSIDISKNLGARGLTGTMDLLTAAIAKHMGPAGTVLIETLKKSAGSTTDFQKVLADLPPTQQTYIAALAKMVGGTKSMQAALELTGSNAKTFHDNVTAIGGATTEAGGHVKGFALTQQDLNTKLANLTAGMQSLLIEVGDKLIPVIADAIGFFNKHKDVTIALAYAVGGLVAGLVVYKAVQVATAVATGAWTAAQWLLNAALDANPIGLVIIGIAALVAGIIIAYRHSETFRHIVQGAFHAVAAAIDFVKDHWKVFATVFAFLLGGPILGAIVLLVTHFRQVKDAIVGTFEAVIGFIRKLPGRIGSAASGMWDGIKDAFKAAINWIIDGWNSLHFGIPSIDTHIPGVGKIGGFSVGVPHIPELAMGGIVTRPTLLIAGEGREPEAILPLSKLAGLGGGPQVIQLFIDGREVRTTVKRQQRLLGGIA